MPAFDFPATPTLNDIYTANGVTYICTNTNPSVWKKIGSDTSVGSTKVAVLRDRKNNSIRGGKFEKDGWRGRDLTEKIDPSGFVNLTVGGSVSSPSTGTTPGIWSLPAGNYEIEWSAPCHRVGRNRSRLTYSTASNFSSASVSYAYSASGYAPTAFTTNNQGTPTLIAISNNTDYYVNYFSSGKTVLHLTETHFFKIEHYSNRPPLDDTSDSEELGFGVDAGSTYSYTGILGDEIYTTVKITDLKTAVKEGFGSGGGTGTTKVAVLKDQKNTTVGSGAGNATAWTDRDITVKTDPSNFVTLNPRINGETTPSTAARRSGANGISYFSLPAGTYKIKFRATGYYISQHQAAMVYSSTETNINKVFSTSDTVNVIYGTSETSVNNSTSSDSTGSEVVTINETTYFKVIHYIISSFGASDFGQTSSPGKNVYLIIEIEDLTTSSGGSGGGSGNANVATSIQTFTTAGTNTYTPTSGTTSIIVHVIGAGGASGTPKNYAWTGGGGAGGVAIKTYNLEELGANASVIVPAATGYDQFPNQYNGPDGGDASFNPSGTGPTITGHGGKGSSAKEGGGASGSNQFSEGGDGGAATNGDLNYTGEKGVVIKDASWSHHTLISEWRVNAGSSASRYQISRAKPSAGGYGDFGLGGEATFTTANQWNNGRGGTSGAVIIYEFAGSGVGTTKVALIRHVESSGTSGGAAPNTSSFNTRKLNDLNDPNGMSISLSNNIFSLPAGTYKIDFSTPFYHTQYSQSRLKYSNQSNVVSGTLSYITGSSLYAGPGSGGETVGESDGHGIITLTETNYFILESRVSNSDSSYDFGIQCNYTDEVYSQVRIEDLTTAVKSGSTFFSSNIHLADNVELQLGTQGAIPPNGDLRIFHDGSESKIWDNGTGGLVLQTASSPIELRAIDQHAVGTNEIMLKANVGGSVDLYEDGAARFTTTSNGVKIIGGLQDKDGDLGTSGQILSSTGTTLNWVDLLKTASARLIGNDFATSSSAYQAAITASITPARTDSSILVVVTASGQGHWSGNFNVNQSDAEVSIYKHGAGTYNPATGAPYTTPAAWSGIGYTIYAANFTYSPNQQASVSQSMLDNTNHGGGTVYYSVMLRRKNGGTNLVTLRKNSAINLFEVIT